MPPDAPDPATVRATITGSPVDTAFAELDRICRRYDESLTLELAEDTYADLARGIDRLHAATCYVSDDLAALKRRFPGSVFSGLPDGYDAYALTTDEATLRLKFGQSHADRRPVTMPYDAVAVAVPTTDAYFERFYTALAERGEDGTHFNADG
ncbi:hypothetical protein [Haloplanus aerogenes]|uniref:Uncharacterized protein n=1 Tax=Haloplanus aerogenes TaxID=660522 RepID=A0A3M0D9B0_9EURY|nr:hypothetical protein [Haloplanus aerogenes]AZH26290.1 hypothetical protein DU502_13365 [Haloplanus aerogenes]RMB18252.1 hypothetical protein ATH50_1702 [Haloplanus aerogenes]